MIELLIQILVILLIAIAIVAILRKLGPFAGMDPGLIGAVTWVVGFITLIIIIILLVRLLPGATIHIGALDVFTV